MIKPFQFKQFAVVQEYCAMKVGTDGVLLGAWAKAPSNVQTILDIGTGSGLIAMQMAQRFEEAKVWAIDIDAGAYKQACENFQNSPFADRLCVEHIALQDFQTEQKFDCIVSNPPFFTDGILPNNEMRKLARHTTEFSFELFFEKAFSLLNEQGLLSIIVPKIQFEILVDLAKNKHLFCQECCTVYPNPQKEAKRVLLTFGRIEKPCNHTNLTIETNERHHYTTAYHELLREFYLAF